MRRIMSQMTWGVLLIRKTDSSAERAGLDDLRESTQPYEVTKHGLTTTLPVKRPAPRVPKPRPPKVDSRRETRGHLVQGLLQGVTEDL